MRIVSTNRLRGPNVYLRRPVQVARVHLAGLTGQESTDFPDFPQRLLAAVPGLAQHHCAAGKPGGFAARISNGTYFGHVAEHVAIELSQLIGRRVHFGRTVETDERGVYDIITECPEWEPMDSVVPRRLLEAAIDVVGQVLAGEEPGYANHLEPLRDQFEREMPGPSTAAIIAAARRRGIPVERVGRLSLLQLGHGYRRRLAWAAMSDQTSAIGVEIAGDKELTRQLLDRAGIPVPPGGPADSVEEAVELFIELAGPVVVKPRHGRQGRHVQLNVKTVDGVRAAVTAAGEEVVVERQVEGRDYRVLMVAGRVVAAAERVPAHVVGDGVHTVADLVGRVNADPARGNGHSRILTRLRLDEIADGLLAEQGLTQNSVPHAGQTVWLCETANLSTGGTSVDVTDRLHPDVIALCQRVAKIVGLDIAGIDLRLPDVAVPVPLAGSDSAGAVIEVNAAPGLRMHLAPTVGEPRDVGQAIVDALFPPDDDGRIPTVAVTGTNGKTSTARLAAHLLAGSGLLVGLTSTDGVYVNGRMVQKADATGPRSAQAVLGDPTVQAVVLETARGGMLRQGLGFDWADVGVVTNISADHLGQDGLTTVEDIAHVKALVAEQVRDGGTLVLNADDPQVRGLVHRPRVRADHKRIAWFTLDPANPLVRDHLASGGTAYLIDEDWLVEVTGGRRTPLLAVADLPGAFNGAAGHMAANALAAAAVARAFGIPENRIGPCLRSFEPEHGNPGRGMLLRYGPVHLFVDYAHNPAAIDAVTQTLHRLWGAERCIAVVTLPGDRRNDLLLESARVIARGFGRVVLYPDLDLRGRQPGELSELLRRELIRHRPDVRCDEADDATHALEKALTMADPGDVVLFVYEKLDVVRSLLEPMDQHWQRS